MRKSGGFFDFGFWKVQTLIPVVMVFLSGKWISKSQGLCLMDRISKIAINDSADLHMQRFVHVIAYCAWFDVQVEELRFLWS